MFNFLKRKKKEENTDKNTVYFARIKKGAELPSKREEDAGMDIYACFEQEKMVIKPHETVSISTGIKSACDPSLYFQLEERGSTGIKGLSLRCGVIDSGYRGEWFIALTNTNEKPVIITKTMDKDDEYPDAILYDYYKAIAQVVVLPVPKVYVKEISENLLSLMVSERMEGNIGSSGK